jgi:hypothetical protein
MTAPDAKWWPLKWEDSWSDYPRRARVPLWRTVWVIDRGAVASASSGIPRYSVVCVAVAVSLRTDSLLDVRAHLLLLAEETHDRPRR